MPPDVSAGCCFRKQVRIRSSSRLLQDFFTKRYGALVLPKPQEEDELSQVKNVYRALVAEGFYELMSGEMEAMKGIMKLLTDRLRETIK